MKRLIKILTVLIASVLLLVCLPVLAADDGQSGSGVIASDTCGTCEWVIDEDGVLTISEGEMEDWGSVPPWYEYRSQITSVRTGGTVYLTTAKSMFYDCANMTSADVSDFDTSKVTSMTSMFAGCGLETIDLSSFDTSRTISMQRMFRGCSAKELDLTGFDTSNVQDMSYMFQDSSSDLNLSSFVIPADANIEKMLDSRGLRKITTGDWTETAQRPVIATKLLDTATGEYYKEGDTFPPVNRHTFVYGCNTTGGYTITNVTLNKTVLEWGDSLEVTVDYKGSEPVQIIHYSFFNEDYSKRFDTSDAGTGYFIGTRGLQIKDGSFDEETGEGTFTIKTCIYTSCQIGKYPQFKLHLYGQNTFDDILDEAEFFDMYTIEVKAPHEDPVFEMDYRCEDLPDALSSLQDGDTAVIRGEELEEYQISEVKRDEYVAGMLYTRVSADIYNMIKGRDITILLPMISGSSYVEINGMDVGDVTKDIYFANHTNTNVICGISDDGNLNIQIFQDFPNNGELPSKTTYRFLKERWVLNLRSSLRQLKEENPEARIDEFFDDALLYYLINNQSAVEDGKYELDGNWIAMTLDHNSNYVLTDSDPHEIRSFTAFASKSRFTYNGKVQKPTVNLDILKGYGRSSNYAITYSNKNSKGVGTYKITVKAQSIGFGKKTLKYTINPKGTSLTRVVGKKRAAQVLWKKQASKMPSRRISGYNIQVSTSKSKISKGKIYTAKGYSRTSTTIKNLKSKKTYYVRIRTYMVINGVKYYSGWSGIKAVKVK